MNKKEFNEIVNNFYTFDFRLPEDFWFNKNKGRERYYDFLCYLVRQMGKDLQIIELGTDTGLSAKAFAYHNDNAIVNTIDHNLECVNNFSVKDVESICFYCWDINDVNHFNWFKDVDILFIDANHNKKDLLNQFKLWSPKVKKGGVILMDDIILNDEMKEAFEEIKKNNNTFELNGLHWSGFGAVIKK